jgi:hypothetical protein
VGGIFICYRRDDGYAAGRLHDGLLQEFSRDQIFLDVDNIEPGQTFANAIQERVAASDAMIVVIGPEWLNSSDSKGQRRLDDPKDFVRLEIEAALKRDIRVIPVLLDAAEMPQAEALPASIRPLTERQAVRFHHASFSREVGYLNSALAKVVASTKQLDSQWKATISSRKYDYVCIEFWQLKERHRLEMNVSGFFNKVYLDGNIIAKGHSNVTEFQLPLHPNQFHLVASRGFLGKLKNIKLLIDNQLTLAVE